MAKALMETVFARSRSFEVLAEIPGTALKGMEYVPLFDFAVGKLEKKAWFVVCDNYVTMTDGTGIVHIAPAFGEDDNRVGRENDVPFVNFVDPQGCMTAETKWPGVFVKKADPLVLADLQERGLLFSAPQFTHDYPFCWRCDTPLLYYARPTWFIRMTARARQPCAQQPHRQLDAGQHQGRPHGQVPGERPRLGSVPRALLGHAAAGVELHLRPYARHRLPRGAARNGDKVPANLELHRPYIDDVKLRCEKCGGEMHRDKEVIDCWYDSGSMPFAQWHYPFENQEEFEQHFPADFISEAIDQTRGWFYTLLAISTLLFDRAPFENCIVLGHVQDKDGNKMSKHLGNVVDPWNVLNKQGADAVRWYFYNNAAPWLPNRFSRQGGRRDDQRKYMGTLWNTYAFFILYAEIDQFDPKEHPLDKAELTLMDRWILSRLNSLVREVDDDLNEYKIFEASRAMTDFVDDLSNWYVRRSRERFWGKGMAGDKEAAFATLYHVLETMSRLTAPFTPFMAENMYRNLVCSVDKDAPISVHMTDFPVCDETYIRRRAGAAHARPAGGRRAGAQLPQ